MRAAPESSLLGIFAGMAPFSFYNLRVIGLMEDDNPAGGG